MLAEMAVRQRQVAQRLSQLRDQHELTQEQAAQRVGITVRQWQRWEDGTSMPHARNLKLTADAFGIRVQDFFDEAEIERIKGGANGELRPYDLEGRIDTLEQKLDELLRNQEVMLRMLRVRQRTARTRPNAPQAQADQQAPPRKKRAATRP